jgi:hypothetical protein
MASNHSGAKESVLGRVPALDTPLLTAGMVSIAMVLFPWAIGYWLSAFSNKVIE